MKWYEFNEDLGDGTSRAVRFRTKEEATKARAWAEKQEYFQGDGDGSPVTEVDTDSDYFFDSIEEYCDDE